MDEFISEPYREVSMALDLALVLRAESVHAAVAASLILDDLKPSLDDALLVFARGEGIRNFFFESSSDMVRNVLPRSTLAVAVVIEIFGTLDFLVGMKSVEVA